MAFLFILATLRCFVELFTSIIVKFVTTWYCSESMEDQKVHKDLATFKKEMNKISLADEFAKFVKLQRQYIKLEDKAKERFDERLALKIKLRLFFKYGVRILNGIFTSILLILYRKEPVIIFPSGYLWPLENILSWPTSVDNCISLPSWIILTEMSLLSYMKQFTS